MSDFDVSSIRKHFPILQKSINGRTVVYFDNGATTLTPASVVEKEQEYYQEYNANVHRGAHHFSTQATSAFESSRKQVQTFIQAKHSHEVIWTKGTTESINLVAQSWGQQNLSEGDEIVLTHAEHHANVVPWQVIAEKTGAKVKVLPLLADGTFDSGALESVITHKTKMVCCAHISNVVGKINPIEKLIKRAKAVGAKTLIDGAQAIAHIPVDVTKLDCDFYVFSAHKLYGPTGLGVLYGKSEVLNKMPVYQSGGEMIKKVSFSGTTYNDLPFKFEPGTPNISAVIALSEAIQFVSKNRLNELDYKNALVSYCYEKLSTIKALKLLVESKPDIPLFSFNVEGHHQKDISTALDSKGIAVRAGHHCAMPLMEYLNVSGCIRISLAPYNTFEEVDYFVNALKEIIQEDISIENVEVEQDQIVSESDEILNKFSKAKGWDSKHREIMLLGKSLPRMDKSLRSDDTLISGCESAAWLLINKSPSGIFTIEADSDAKIIRGLLVIVLAVFNGKTAAEISQVNIDGYFKALGLMSHLSPSRGNGLLAIVNKIQVYVSNN